jgi:hypothetical protein
MAIEPQFNEGDPQFNARFADGLCAVRYGSKWGFIDKTGKVAINPRFGGDMYQPPQFVGGLAAVRVENGVGFIDTSGNLVIAPGFRAYSFMPWFRPNGYALAIPSQELLDAEHLGTAKSGTAEVARDASKFVTAEGEVWIDRKGNVAPIEVATRPALGLPVVYKEGNLYGLKDNDGKVMVPPTYSAIDDFSEGLAAVTVGEEYGYIDQRGVVVIPVQFSAASVFLERGFSEGMAPVFYPKASRSDKKEGGLLPDGTYGYIDRTGKVVINPVFNFAHAFSQGLASVDVPEKGCGYIEKKGSFIVPPDFLFCNSFSDGMAMVTLRGEKFGLSGMKGWLKR